MKRDVGDGKLGLNMQQVAEYVEISSNEDRTAERRRRNFRLRLGAFAAAALGLSVISGVHNEGPEDVVEKTADGGEATVRFIDYKFSEQRVVKFETEVDGASATDILKRTGPLGIPLPDIEAGMRVDNYVVDSALCFDAKSKEIEKITYRNSDRIHYKVTIDPADIRVCSQQNMLHQALTEPTGNFIEFINNSGDDLNRALGINKDSTDAENIKKSALVQDAQVMALYTVNMQCGPLVFEEAKDEMQQLIADDVARSDNETVEVIYKVNKNGEVAISGQSELDEKIKKMQREGRNLNAGTVGKCELPPHVAGGADERPQNS